uniref:Uncharacterized protein n=1 Tax=Globisporangium ultimum (strain ATCC 200006 / CBS 805.95 / DAOM BR144) TaxID=431595 RepID=K3WY84_GLOUD
MSDEFEMHVQVDEGVLATSAPLPVEKLEHVLRLTHDGMRSVPSVQAQIKDLCVNFTEKKVVGAASVMEQMLAILKKDALALEYFKTSIMS